MMFSRVCQLLRVTCEIINAFFKNDYLSLIYSFTDDQFSVSIVRALEFQNLKLIIILLI